MPHSLILAFAAAAASGGAPPPSFYERMIEIGVYENRDGVLTKRPFKTDPAALSGLAWLGGDWNQANVMIANGRIPASSKAAGALRFSVDAEHMTVMVQGMSAASSPTQFLAFDPYARLWVKSLTPPYSYGVLTGRDWSDGRLDLVGRVTLAGVSFLMRQRIIRTGPDGFEVQNSEQLRDGTWRMIDKHVYTRPRAS
jgi:hypothetical protein